MHINLLFHSERVQETFVSVIERIHRSDVNLDLPGMSTLAQLHMLVVDKNIQPPRYKTNAAEFDSYLSKRYPGKKVPTDSPVIVTSTTAMRISLIGATEILRRIKVDLTTLRQEIMLEDLRENGKTLIICDPIYRSLIGAG